MVWKSRGSKVFVKNNNNNDPQKFSNSLSDPMQIKNNNNIK